MKPKALILTGYGLNTDYELQHGFELAGADAKRVHLNDLIDGRVNLKDFQMLAIPGGFAFADDLGGGKIFAQRLKSHLYDALMEFVESDKLIFSACNGFQILVKLGMLPATSGYGEQEVTLTFNDSGRFENRWVYLKVNPKSKCIFTRDIHSLLYFPVRHGEGKFVPRDEQVLRDLQENNQIVTTYVNADGEPDGFPWNPNGSIADVAGVCDPTGRIFGLMPHPEAFLYRYNHPRWTRENLPEEGQGLKLFKNAVAYVSSGVGV
ncbi:phosphoribosylformylglycinamidine synthase subunit PurQ [Candidatus Acetothermia bacterium]|nr:phosphoribosylformylglycinamidine synthase subunit PurQ [Candidatus Acetothermia bacterium]MBI3643104.1 phosphoribosylformylglycinamidine synthase subunit PurQ [Candidatus Acetothermia bacterium]